MLIQRLVEALRLEQLRDPLAWLDIVLLAFVIYQVLLLIRRTRAVQVSYGLLLLLVLWFFTDPSGLVPLKAVHEVLGTLLFYLPFVVIVQFQSSIKQALARFGALSFLPLRQPEIVGDPAILEVALAASSMASTPVKVQQVSKEMGVQYVLEGSIQWSDDRVQITAQLIDALKGHHQFFRKDMTTS